MEARTICPLLGMATALLISSAAQAQYIMQGGPVMNPVVVQPGAVHWGGIPPGARPARTAGPAFQPTSGRRGQAHARSQNFIVFADSPEWANQVAEVAETERARLAKHWLGQELPPWPEPCPIHVEAKPNLGAGGETRFQLMSLSTGQRTVGNWTMIVQGTKERILDSVLPHEITHTIFATYFSKMGKYVPRWADEGACTTVEHESEKRKHRHYLHEFLQTGRGLAFNQMFRLKEYPDDILPLYAQGHSAVQFLIDQSSPNEFIQFIEEGMRTEDWNGTLRKHYAYESIGEFQTLWNEWLFDGSPEDKVAYAPKLQGRSDILLASNARPAGGNRQETPTTTTNPPAASPTSPNGKIRFAITNTDPAPVQLVAGDGSYYQQRLREVQSGKVIGTPSDTQAAMHPARTNTWQPLARSASNDRVNPPKNNHGTIGGVERPNAVSLTPVQSALPTSQPIAAAPAALAPLETAPQYVAPQSTARQQAPQRAEVRVLDWGQSQPVRGIEATGTTRMVPIRR